MKVWKPYERFLLNGEWHVHTSFTDGKCTAAEIAGAARRADIPLVAFTEHVRKSPAYDFYRFIDAVEDVRSNYPEMVVLSGVEAKILPDGTVDVDDEYLRAVDYPIFAIHGFPADKDLLFHSLMSAIKNRYLNAWAHPYSFFRGGNVRFDDADLSALFTAMAENNVLFELNEKYGMPPDTWIERARNAGVRFVRGSDIHDIEQIKSF